MPTTLKRKWTTSAAALLGVGALALASCSSDQSSSSRGAEGDTAGSAGTANISSFVLPDNQAYGPQTITNTIANAENSLDIIVYGLGSPDILAALKTLYGKLSAKGVTPKAPLIRINTNSQWFGEYGATNHTNYVQNMMDGLGVDTATGKSKDGIIQFNWSPENFTVTHQKSVIADARQADGTDYESASQLPSSAVALVLTANLQAYDWENTKYPCQDPCVFEGSGVGTRDIGATVTDQDLVYKISNVATSDFNNPSPTTTNGEYIDPSDTQGALVWSNGSTGFAVPFTANPDDQTYPVSVTGEGDQVRGNYPYPQYKYKETPAGQQYPGQIKGNARAVHLDIIKNAQKTLWIYNEEYADDEVTAAIHAAAQRGVEVQVVMTYSTSGGWVYNWNELTSDTNAAVHLFPGVSAGVTNSSGSDCPVENVPSQSKYCGYNYIHAKMLYADAGQTNQNLYFGSQNISDTSLDQNRELGVHLTGDQISDADEKLLSSTFQGDFAATGKNAQVTTRGQTVACPVVVIDKANPLSKDRISSLADTGCENPSGTKTNAKKVTKLLVKDRPTDAFLANLQQFVIPTVDADTCPITYTGDLAGMTGCFTPALPQGPSTWPLPNDNISQVEIPQTPPS